MLNRFDSLKDKQEEDIQNLPLDFEVQLAPSLEFPAFEVNGLEPSAICGTWLSTDHNLFAVCYEGGHLAFFDVSKGTICQQYKIESEESEITCIVAHNLESVVVLGLDSGGFIAYDYRQQQKIKDKEPKDLDRQLNELVADAAVQSMKFINNELELVVGYQTGVIALFNYKSLELLCVVKNSHTLKGADGLNSILTLCSSQN
jgi:WD40 repeat protein